MAGHARDELVHAGAKRDYRKFLMKRYDTSGRKPGHKRTWEDPVARQIYLVENPFCELCATVKEGGVSMPAIEVHHILGRGWIGADEEHNFIATCRFCHEAVETHPRWNVVCLYLKCMNAALDLEHLSACVQYNVKGKLPLWSEGDHSLDDMVKRLLTHA